MCLSLSEGTLNNISGPGIFSSSSDSSPSPNSWTRSKDSDRIRSSASISTDKVSSESSQRVGVMFDFSESFSRDEMRELKNLNDGDQ